ncbi:AraC family transcriptional regulator [Actinoplanes sp. M2I2]|uniref:helix-turn-helix domain-containing protein n=1 Tax=Actinoplanes sp. M2I2 TaxID=1734444 RepID=UPI00201FBEAA|nr:AraC family transcriptional regulator [Actinoplanes sp. M2I2]
MAAAHDDLPKVPSQRLESSTGLGWRTVEAAVYADPPAIGEFRVEPDRLMIVLATSGHYQLEHRKRGRWHSDERRPGSICIVTPGQQNLIRWRSTSNVPMRSVHLLLDPTAAGDVSVFDESNDHDPFVTASTWTLSNALDKGAPALYADSIAQALLAHLAWRARRPQRHGAEQPPSLSRHQVDQVTDYMRARLAENIMLEELAAVANVSKFHFIRTFNATTGLTPFRYLRRMRLQRAAELLRGTAYSVVQIAPMCGYRSARQFATAFRAEFGVSPTAFRR